MRVQVKLQDSLQGSSVDASLAAASVARISAKIQREPSELQGAISQDYPNHLGHPMRDATSEQFGVLERRHFLPYGGEEMEQPVEKIHQFLAKARVRAAGLYLADGCPEKCSPNYL